MQRHRAGPSCVFCSNPRTTKRGEHVWDDWLNREDGKAVRRPSTVFELGRDGVILRQYKTIGFKATKAVVCDHCNQTWMSDLTTHAKLTLEGFIRHERPATLLPLGIITVVTFAFMKAAVLDYSAEATRRPFISPTTCSRFRHSLAPGSRGPALPAGLQVWIAKYRGERKIEARATIDHVELTGGQFKGYGILIITYVIGAFAFQLTFPRWNKGTKRRTEIPMLKQNAWIWDSRSTPVWPAVYAAPWPPPEHLDRASLEHFRERFKTLLIPRPQR